MSLLPSNFLALLATKKLKKNLDPNDLVVIGTRNPLLNNGYDPTVMRMADFLPQAVKLAGAVTGGNQTLEQTLSNGNTTGVNDIIVNQGQSVDFLAGEALGQTAALNIGAAIYFILKVGSKIYATDYNETIYVLDENLTTVLTTYTNVPNYKLSYNSTLNRIYVGTWNNSGIMHYIDNATDTLIAVNNGFLGGSDYIQYSTFDNRVYGYDYYTQSVAVFDTDLNLITSVNIPNFNGFTLFVNEVNGDVWLQGRNASFENEVIVLDNSLSILFRYSTPGNGPEGEGIAKAGNKIYVNGGSNADIDIYDAVTRALIGSVSRTGLVFGPIIGYNSKILYSPQNIGLGYREVYEIDSVTDTLLLITSSPDYSAFAAFYDNAYYIPSASTSIVKLENSTITQKIAGGSPTADTTHLLPTDSGTIAQLSDLVLSVDGQTLAISGGNSVTLPGASISIANVAYVDKTIGNDFTAVVGSLTKPYGTVNAAAGAAGVSLVVLRPGTYGDIINLVSNVIYYAMPGVKVSGVIQDLTSTGKNIRWYGYAELTSFAQSVNINSDAVAYFEFAKMTDTAWIARAFGSCKVTIKCPDILCNGFNGAAYCCAIRGTSELTVIAANKCYVQHTLANPRDTAKFTITCPDIQVLNAYTTTYGNTAKALIVGATNGAWVATINGNSKIVHSVATGEGAIDIYNQFSESIVTVNGNIDSGVNACISTYFENYAGKVIINGNLTSLITPIVTHTWNTGNPSTHTIILNNSYIKGRHLFIGQNRQVYFNSCRLLNTDGTPSVQNILIELTFPTSPAKLYFYNCLAENTGATSEFIKDTSGINTEVSTVNTVGNSPLGTGLTDLWAGYTQIASFKLPK